MTLHRIEQALVLDTDDIPGRGGYGVVGISAGVKPAERAFIAGNFGISDYLHDPKTEDRIFYSVFRVPGGRHAFVRRFARGNELRRNNTQRRLVIHTLLLDDNVWNALYALPWLLLNASVRAVGTTQWELLRSEVPWVDDGAVLPPLEWDSGDGAASGVAAKLASRLTVIGNQLGSRAPEPRELLARVMTALGSQARVALPQDPGYEWVTMLAWSMLPRHDRDELAWTQHDSANLAGVAFPLSNAIAADFDPAHIPSELFARELVRMNTESEGSWLDLQERTSHNPLTVRKPAELDAWMKWRDALLKLRDNIHAPEKQVLAYMNRLAGVVRINPNATWIDGGEVLRLVWANVHAAMTDGTSAELAVTTWGERLRGSGLGEVIFRAAPSPRWLASASEDVGADPLVWFFLSGGGEDAESKPTRAALARWLIDAKVHDVNSARLTMLAFLIASDRSALLDPLLELLLETRTGLDALLDYLKRRQGGGLDLIHAAVPIVLRRGHPSTLAFLRDVFAPRFETSRVDAPLARQIALVLRDDPPLFIRFAARVTPKVEADLMALVRQWVSGETERTLPLARLVLADLEKQEGRLEAAGPLALALAEAGEPARTWFGVVMRLAKMTDSQNDANAKREFLEMLRHLQGSQLDLGGAMEPLIAQLAAPGLWVHDSIRGLIMLLRPVWAKGESRFVNALLALMDRATRATAWEEIVITYAADHRKSRRADVSELATAFWIKVDPSQMESLDARTIDLLGFIEGAGVSRLAYHWSQASKLRSLPQCPASDRLLGLVHDRRRSVNHQVELDLALREIEQGVVKPPALNRLEAALAKLHGAKAASKFADEVDLYLGGDSPAARMIRLLDLLASDEILPSVRLVLQTKVLTKALKAMKRRHWIELRQAARDQDLLALGAVLRLAYATGARADRGTLESFERTWQVHRRDDALDALDAGRRARGPWQWIIRQVGFAEPSVLAR